MKHSAVDAEQNARGRRQRSRSVSVTPEIFMCLFYRSVEKQKTHRGGEATPRSVLKPTLLDTDTGTVDRSVIISVTCEELQVETIRSRRGLQGIMGI